MCMKKKCCVPNVRRGDNWTWTFNWYIISVAPCKRNSSYTVQCIETIFHTKVVQHVKMCMKKNDFVLNVMSLDKWERGVSFL